MSANSFVVLGWRIIIRATIPRTSAKELLRVDRRDIVSEVGIFEAHVAAQMEWILNNGRDFGDEFVGHVAAVATGFNHVEQVPHCLFKP